MLLMRRKQGDVFMDDFFFQLKEFNAISIFLRLFFAVVFGGTIGFERGLRKRAAGLRTFALVCAGAALAMITNEYLFLMYGSTVDPGRMSSQVISGVGFLGAGTIIFNGEKVRGLTTAASLWATAAVGIAIGSGFFLGAFFGFFVIFTATVFMHKLEEKADKNNRLIDVYVEIKKNFGIVELINYISENNFALYSVEKSKNKKSKGDVECFCLEINLRKQFEHGDIVSQVNMLESVVYAEEIK